MEPEEPTMLSIMLPPDLEQILSDQARAQGTTPERLALDSLHERFTPAAPPEPAALQDDYWKGCIGVIDSSEKFPQGSTLSEDCGRKFAEGMVKKREQGKL